MIVQISLDHGVIPPFAAGGLKMGTAVKVALPAYMINMAILHGI
jgi:hypothetical protein